MVDGEVGRIEGGDEGVEHAGLWVLAQGVGGFAAQGDVVGGGAGGGGDEGLDGQGVVKALEGAGGVGADAGVWVVEEDGDLGGLAWGAVEGEAEQTGGADAGVGVGEAVEVVGEVGVVAAEGSAGEGEGAAVAVVGAARVEGLLGDVGGAGGLEEELEDAGGAGGRVAEGLAGGERGEGEQEGRDERVAHGWARAAILSGVRNNQEHCEDCTRGVRGLRRGGVAVGVVVCVALGAGVMVGGCAGGRPRGAASLNGLADGGDGEAAAGAGVVMEGVDGLVVRAGEVFPVLEGPVVFGREVDGEVRASVRVEPLPRGADGSWGYVSYVGSRSVPTQALRLVSGADGSVLLTELLAPSPTRGGMRGAVSWYRFDPPALVLPGRMAVGEEARWSGRVVAWGAESYEFAGEPAEQRNVEARGRGEQRTRLEARELGPVLVSELVLSSGAGGLTLRSEREAGADGRITFTSPHESAWRVRVLGVPVAGASERRRLMEAGEAGE